ncbi:Malonyl-(acyl-carrier protein) O-methyltransferase [Gammaproteobacteria bacterium]
MNSRPVSLPLPGPLDKCRIRRAFERAANRYDQDAILQREVGQRLLERLDAIRLAPSLILDLGAGTGLASPGLRHRYPETRQIALDFAPTMLHRARQDNPGLWLVGGDMEGLPLRSGCADLIFSNLALQWINDIPGALAEMARVLRPGGLLLFSTLGPDTLQELRIAWATVDGLPHVSPFMDLHDLGDLLLATGFSDPVTDVERLILTYPQVTDLMRDLKNIGAHNAVLGRRTGLTGKGRLTAMQQAYEPFRQADRLPATYEVVYGLAWAPWQRPAPDGSVRIPVEAIQRRR